MFRILSIDGGGVRGIVPAHFLALLTSNVTPKLWQTFDLIVGTSTGAIIAAAAACDLPMTTVVELYEKYASTIFAKRPMAFGGVLQSAHSTEPLKTLLHKIFEGKTMAAAKTRLVLPATDISNGNVFVIKSPYLSSFVRDRDIPLASAVVASCAAPSYFDPVKVNEYLLADGGLWANNPSLVAYTEAIGKLRIPATDVRILSLGTGLGHQFYDIGKPPRAWGLATGWQSTRLIDVIFNLQSRAASNTTQLLLGDQYYRVSFEETGSMPLDDVSQVARLKAKAGELFTYQATAIKTFLQL